MNLDKTIPDCAVLHTLESPINEVAALLLSEDKRELAEGVCDPTIQAGLSLARYWSQPDRIKLRSLTCCPTFLIANGGPWLVVLGAVFTDKIICQQLTGMIWIGHNRILNKAHTRYVARVLHSLGRNILKLKDHYNSLATSGSVQVNPLEINIRRFFPSINSYYDDIKQTRVYFDYVEPLEVDPACITFRARTKEGDKEGDKGGDIVVKFVEDYGEDVHRLLAKEGYAPQLFYFGQIDSTDGAPTYGSLRMVVMEYLPGATVAKLQEQGSLRDLDGLVTALQGVMKLLHDRGYVYGDLRSPNVIIMEDYTVKLIDFDWAGKAGIARYPFSISRVIKWPDGVKAGGLITEEQDRTMALKFANL